MKSDMNTRLKIITAAMLGIVFIDLLIIGVKLSDGRYDLIAEGIVGFVGFVIIGCCGFIGLYREVKKRIHNKKGTL